MAIQVRGRHQDPVSVAVTMRTPGNDFELAAGFLVTEGLVHDLHEIAGIRYCDVAPDEQHYNVVTVDLTVPFGVDFAERHFFASSSCGICGKASLDQIEVNCPMIEPGPVVARSTIVSLPDALRRSQPIFEQTGGLHAAALFDTDGRLLESREDVGRHNAVDKLIGNALLNAEDAVAGTAAAGLGTGEFRDRAKGCGRGHPDHLRSLRALEPGGAGGRAAGNDSRRLPPGGQVQRLLPQGPNRPRGLMLGIAPAL